MEFEWDDAKDAANRAKHGVSLAEAARLDWARARIVTDLRGDYGEDRRIAYGLIDGRLFTCVWTGREGRTRIISLRKSNAREIRDHGKSKDQTAD